MSESVSKRTFAIARSERQDFADNGHSLNYPGAHDRRAKQLKRAEASSHPSTVVGSELGPVGLRCINAPVNPTIANGKTVKPAMNWLSAIAKASARDGSGHVTQPLSR